MLTKLSNNRIDLSQCAIVPASHAFKKEMAMDGSNRILSARLGEDIIVTSSPGERSVHGLQGLDLSNGQHISYNHALNNCHDSMTNHKEKYPNINIVDLPFLLQQVPGISLKTGPHFFSKLLFSYGLLGAKISQFALKLA